MCQANLPTPGVNRCDPAPLQAALEQAGKSGESRHSSGEEIIQQLTRWANRAAERHGFRASEKQSLLDISLQCEGEPRIDAELPDRGDAIAQSAYREAVETRHAAPRIGFGVGLQRFLAAQIVS